MAHSDIKTESNMIHRGNLLLFMGPSLDRCSDVSPPPWRGSDAHNWILRHLVPCETSWLDRGIFLPAPSDTMLPCSYSTDQWIRLVGTSNTPPNPLSSEFSLLTWLSKLEAMLKRKKSVESVSIMNSHNNPISNCNVPSSSSLQNDNIYIYTYIRTSGRN